VKGKLGFEGIKGGKKGKEKGLFGGLFLGAFWLRLIARAERGD
jgi:hypothetical protein